ncbi:MAG: hypothetical protein ABUL77_03290 [Bacteroidota bacterium]
MSIFGKKPDNNVVPEPEAARPVATGHVAPAYGIVEAMQLMRSLPLDQSPQNIELVVRVVRATLASMQVRVQDIIEDASRRQRGIQDGIAALHAQVTELEKQVEGKRREIASHEADLRETTGVKERLLLTERAAPQAAPSDAGSGPIGGLFSSLPPPPAPAHPPAPHRASLPRPGDREDSGRGRSG